MTKIDWNAKLADEILRILTPEQRATALAYCGVHRITLAEFVEGVVTAPGGALDRAGINVEEIANLPTGAPIAMLVASVLQTARTTTMEQR